MDSQLAAAYGTGFVRGAKIGKAVCNLTGPTVPDDNMAVRARRSLLAWTKWGPFEESDYFKIWPNSSILTGLLDFEELSVDDIAEA